MTTFVLYVEEYLENIIGYFKELECNSDSTAVGYFRYLTPGKINSIQCEANFAKDHCISVVNLIRTSAGNRRWFSDE